jgi:hypothetical protein
LPAAAAVYNDFFAFYGLLLGLSGTVTVPVVATPLVLPLQGVPGRGMIRPDP